EMIDTNISAAVASAKCLLMAPSPIRRVISMRNVEPSQMRPLPVIGSPAVSKIFPMALESPTLFNGLMRPPRTAVPLIITINVLIYLLWLLISRSNLDFMTDHFLVSWTGLMLGRGWTLITSVFSHMMFFHLFLNMYVFLGFGSF